MNRFFQQAALSFFLILTLLAPVLSVNAESPVTAPVEPHVDQDFSFTDDWPAGPELVAEAAILIEAKTGTVIYAKNADQQYYPASITKIMTGLLTCENASLSDTVTYSNNAVFSLEYGAMTIGISPGEQLSVKDSLYGLLLQSANETGNGLAEHIAGSTEAFAEMMNKRAKEAGALNTHFVNPHGLHDDNHYTTCYDMAMIMRAAIQNSTYLQINSTNYYVIPPTNSYAQERAFYMLHTMRPGGAYEYEGYVCGKTGFTDQAGNTLVTYCKRGDMELIAVVLKDNKPNHTLDTIALMDYGFNNFTMYHMSEQDAGSISGKTDYFSSIQNIFDRTSTSIGIGKNSWVILPNQALLSDIESSSVYSQTDNQETNLIADISYTYKGVTVGHGTLELMSSDQNSFSFDNSAKQPQTSENNPEESIPPTKKEVIKIHIWQLVLYLILGIFAIAALTFLIWYNSPKKRRIRLAKRKRLKQIRRRMENRRRFRDDNQF